MKRVDTVWCLSMSLDGKIAAPKGPNTRLASRADLDRLRRLRAWADAVVVGANTVRAIDPPMGLANAAARRRRVAAGRAAEPLICVVSRHGRGLRADARAFAAVAGRPRPLLATAGPPRAAPAALLARLARREVQHVSLGRPGPQGLRRLWQALATAGVRHVLVEGGGELGFGLLQAGLVNELHLTVAPLALGGQWAPGAVGGAGWPLARAPRFVLTRAQMRGSELWLVYRARPSPRLGAA